MIDANLSEQYGIMPYGLRGMEILRGGRSVYRATTGTRYENWLACLEWAREHEERG